MRKDKVFLILTAGILLSFFAGIWYGQQQVVCDVCPPEDLDFSLFWEAWHKIEERYVKPENIDTQQLLYGAIAGMVSSIDDPYTVFLDPERSEMFLDDTSGEFEGVGMEVGLRNGHLEVIAPLEGTPAQKAGLRAKDIIIKVEDTFTADISLDEAVKLIRGPRGTEVNLTIFRESWGESREVSIVRDVIEIPSLDWEIIDGNIAYIQLYNFSAKARTDFRAEVTNIANSGADRIILDLRDNPGGYLEVAQDIASWFLDDEEVVVIEESRESGREEYLSFRNGTFVGYPIVILINEGTASGSEILAGAIRDNQGGVLIGETSYGKGSVQEMFSLRDGSNLKITTARWLIPSGESISEVGLEPDIEVELTEEDIDNDKDPQLDKAIETVKGL